MTNSLNSSAPHLHDAGAFNDLVDWGVQPGAAEPASRSSGRLLYKGPGNSPEVGLWVCTPGTWPLEIPRDEFCYFLAGRATYRHESGDEIHVEPGTAVLFPGNWKGVCTVHETLRNTYMLR